MKKQEGVSVFMVFDIFFPPSAPILYVRPTNSNPSEVE